MNSQEKYTCMILLGSQYEHSEIIKHILYNFKNKKRR